ncbi:MAG: hypothetical protein ABI621_04720 [Chloroflexota bacterium]
MSNTSGYPFENVPYGRLPMKVSRGKLFPALLTELGAFSNRANGGVVRKLEDLGTCPDEQLALITPAIATGCKIIVEGRGVYAQLPSVSQAFEIFPLDTPAEMIFDLFDGMTTLDEMSDYLARQTNWEVSRAFAYTRGFFLWLVLAGVCLPKGY